MKQVQIASVWIILVMLSGCASLGSPAPETNIERLTYVESAYGVVLDTATRLRDEGQFTESQTASITKAFDEYETSRDLAQIAIDVGDAGGFETNIGAINAALAAIRLIITETQ